MKVNLPLPTMRTHEGGVANRIGPVAELRRTLMTCLLWENTFYESGNSVAQRIKELVPKCPPEEVLELAIRAKQDMRLRHAPLFVLRELARVKGNGRVVERGLDACVRRADEMAEFMAMYWKDGRCPISAAVKRALANAFTRFNVYELAKWNRDGSVKMRDVMFMVHPKPLNDEQANVWKKLVDGTLESPDTWEVELSAGKDKRATFERLIRERKLGGMACLMNLRNMLQAGVERSLIEERLASGCGMALPFRFVTAARYAPQVEGAIERAMFKSIEGMPKLEGRTGLLVDVSGSMNGLLSSRGETNRLDVACGLAILLRELGDVQVATFSHRVVEIPARRGFALRDAIVQSQPHGGTYLRGALETLSAKWKNLDRLIVITDEQSADGNGRAFAKRNWCVNVSSYRTGVSYGGGWDRVDGWSERIIDYIREWEEETRNA